MSWHGASLYSALNWVLTKEQQCLLKNIKCFSSDINSLNTMFGKCYASWTEAKLQILGLRKKEALGNKPLSKSEKLFWMSPELVESLLPLLDDACKDPPAHYRDRTKRTQLVKTHQAQLATRASTRYARTFRQKEECCCESSGAHH